MTITEQIKAAKAQLASLQSQELKKTFSELKLSVKIGDKGTINIYGLAKFPVCLYLSQAIKIQKLLNSAEFQSFIVENKDKLATRE